MRISDLDVLDGRVHTSPRNDNTGPWEVEGSKEWCLFRAVMLLYYCESKHCGPTATRR